MPIRPLKAIQELLRHVTIEMTTRYSHLSPPSGGSFVLGSPVPTPRGAAAMGGREGPDSITENAEKMGRQRRVER